MAPASSASAAAAAAAPPSVGGAAAVGAGALGEALPAAATAGRASTRLAAAEAARPDFEDLEAKAVFFLDDWPVLKGLSVLFFVFSSGELRLSRGVLWTKNSRQNPS
jgi:hypothetical protein